jgi:hypothetical protein
MGQYLRNPLKKFLECREQLLEEFVNSYKNELESPIFNFKIEAKNGKFLTDFLEPGQGTYINLSHKKNFKIASP